MITRICAFIICIMSALLSNAQEKPFIIKGTISGASDGNIYLNYYDVQAGKSRRDSARIENGRFVFRGQLSEPVEVTVTMDNSSLRMPDNYAQVYIVPGDMELSLSKENLKDAVLKGSPVQDEANELKHSKAAIMEKLNPLRKAYDAANNVYIDAIRAKKDEATLNKLKDDANQAKDAMDPYYEQLEEKDKAFMDKHPGSFVTASVLRWRISGMPLQEGQKRYNALPDAIKNSGTGKYIKTELDGLQQGSPGAKAYVFTSTELRGKPLSLSDYKGKYVLLDFWASWCVPCRKGNPHLLSLYSKYKSKGFEIIGISDDDGKPEAWKKAVEQDKIGVWKHVLRGLNMEKRMKGEKYDSDISDYYGIHSLPTKILIDPNGMIIGRYGGGGENDEAMDKKFREIFGA